MALLSLKVTTAVTPAGGGSAATTTVQSANVTVPATVGLTLQSVGATGATGPTGATGAPGVGASWKGVWSGATTYAIGDGAVGSNGHLYVSNVAGNLNHDPTADAVRWSDILPGLVSAGTATRTNVLQTPAGVGLRDVVSVMDAPFNAVGDGVADDTTPAQNAVNAVSSAGGGVVVFPQGKTFLLGTVTPKNNVTVWAYGATLKLKPSATFGMFFTNTTSVSNFYLRGGTYPGTGAETGNQSILFINTPATGSDVGVFDTVVTNWAAGPFYFGNCVRVRACFNTIRTCCTFTGSNAINLLIGQSAGNVAYNTAIAIGNIIEGCCAEGIAVGETGNTQSAPLYAVIADNIVKCVSGAGGIGNTPINIEWSTATTGQASRIIVAHNHCDYSGSNAASSGIAVTISPASNNDPLLVSRVVIANNTVNSTQNGITCNGSDAIVQGNIVHAATSALTVASSGTFAVTGTTANGSNQVTGVTGSSSIQNGSPITGTGIPSGTFILSGAGTATYTLSQNATGTNSGLTVKSSTTRVRVLNNTLRAVGSPTLPIAQLLAVRDSQVIGNLISADAGSTGTQVGLLLNFCGWIDVIDNTIERAPGHGINVTSSNDFLLQGNHIKNPNEGNNASTHGISIGGVSGVLYRVEGNTIIDDRTAHLMVNGVALQAGAVGVVELLGNEIRGASSAPTTTVANFLLIKNNVTDATTWPAATSAPAAPASGTPTTALPYPAVYYVGYATLGTVTHISLQRTGSSSRDMATTGPATCILAAGDTMTITYSVAPSLMLEPLQL